MRRTEWLQETRMRRFEQPYEGWNDGRLTQAHGGGQAFILHFSPIGLSRISETHAPRGFAKGVK